MTIIAAMIRSGFSMRSRSSLVARPVRSRLTRPRNGDVVSSPKEWRCTTCGHKNALIKIECKERCNPGRPDSKDWKWRCRRSAGLYNHDLHDVQDIKYDQVCPENDFGEFHQYVYCPEELDANWTWKCAGALSGGGDDHEHSLDDKTYCSRGANMLHKTLLLRHPDRLYAEADADLFFSGGERQCYVYHPGHIDLYHQAAQREKKEAAQRKRNAAMFIPGPADSFQSPARPSYAATSSMSRPAGERITSHVTWPCVHCKNTNPITQEVCSNPTCSSKPKPDIECRGDWKWRCDAPVGFCRQPHVVLMCKKNLKCCLQGKFQQYVFSPGRRRRLHANAVAPDEQF